MNNIMIAGDKTGASAVAGDAAACPEAARPFPAESVFRYLKPHLQALEIMLVAQLRDFVPEIRSQAAYCLNTGGKRIRAALVFLAGWRDMDRGIPRADAVCAAAVIEMVHLATLVHDDIMDAAELRRERATAGIRFGLDRSILLGDALFAHALHMAASFPDVSICRAVAASVRRVCGGEIMQTLRPGRAVSDIRGYYRVITLKTAELFRTACELGAQTAGFPASYARAAGDFGRHFGIAYQIYDDLLDYFGREQSAGKTLGGDFKRGIVTLPLIALWKRLDGCNRRQLDEDLARRDAAGFDRCLALMLREGVFDEVRLAATHEMDRARAALHPFQGEEAAGMLQQAAQIVESKLAGLADGQDAGGHDGAPGPWTG